VLLHRKTRCDPFLSKFEDYAHDSSNILLRVNFIINKFTIFSIESWNKTMSPCIHLLDRQCEHMTDVHNHDIYVQV
jgi:hypothetical protein